MAIKEETVKDLRIAGEKRSGMGGCGVWIRDGDGGGGVHGRDGESARVFVVVIQQFLVISTHRHLFTSINPVKQIHLN
jgi:hypothetical protein